MENFNQEKQVLTLVLENILHNLIITLILAFAFFRASAKITCWIFDSFILFPLTRCWILNYMPDTIVSFRNKCINECLDQFGAHIKPRRMTINKSCSLCFVLREACVNKKCAEEGMIREHFSEKTLLVWYLDKWVRVKQKTWESVQKIVD